VQSAEDESWARFEAAIRELELEARKPYTDGPCSDYVCSVPGVGRDTSSGVRRWRRLLMMKSRPRLHPGTLD
jgi:hypothetical protein